MEHLLDEWKMTQAARRRSHERRRDGQVMRIDLITRDGRYDKAAILRDAHYHQYGAMRRHGWSWSRCLSFSWARARAMQERAQLAASGEEEDAASLPSLEIIAPTLTVPVSR
ncbi:hypothetical protein [Methylocystis echinoides]|uniref:hypothetical protein n=1 Tax=Methylocystis echinoides TaxID=29468 RepID=UPI00342D7A42